MKGKRSDQLLPVLFLKHVFEFLGQGLTDECTYSPLAEIVVDPELLQGFAYSVFFFWVHGSPPASARIGKRTI